MSNKQHAAISSATNRRRITIELTPQDEARVKLIQEDTGDPTIVGAIRWALRYLANDLNQTISPRTPEPPK